ncbi:MAG TPA: MoxR family ATPase [Terriglobales bacterium]|jgi:MoxR-like ATPase|nr:MoxR family ATPase [Terriglobales bacterium]
MEAVPKLLTHLQTEMSKVVVGQEELRKQCLLALLCKGHVLLEGVPGIAKTLAVKTLSRLLRLKFQRVQCTSDLMPADITGTNVLNMATSAFQFHAGPVFTDLLLVDEVNRMPPRTQAALLECMEEHQVTIDGTRHQLSPLFTVFATQNPVEFEGTYPLPEAQLDRFLLKVLAGYPEAEQEVQLLSNVQEGFDSRELDRMELVAVEPELLAQAQQETSAVKVEPALFGYIVQVARRTRDWLSLSLGASPRAAISLMAVAKGIAAMDGRDYLIPDDVKSAALPVLRHRLVLKPEADLEGITPDQVIQDVLRAVEVPK